MSTTIRFCMPTQSMLTAFVLMCSLAVSRSYALNLSDQPLALMKSDPPLVMLVMGRDHRLYYEAYNDASDLNSDGMVDYVYKPAEIDYYGYFDSFMCYTYDGNKFFATSKTTAAALKKCTGAQEWSGDWLNYNTMTRMDTLRRLLFGGKRSTDTGGVNGETILERAYVPTDAHSWAKTYGGIAEDGYDIRDYTPFDLPIRDMRHLFGNMTNGGPDAAPLLQIQFNTGARTWNWDRSYTAEYNVRVKVCDKKLPESNCKTYPGPTLKPIGLLQKYGEGNGILFGLMSGSFSNNTQGGVLRRAIGSIEDEINSDGTYMTSGTTYKLNGIIATINRLRIAGWEGWMYKCGWITERLMRNGECQDWGSPLGEMVYEATRYFAGTTIPVSAYNYDLGNGNLRDNQLGLPVAAWKNPYGAGGYATCSKPYLLLIHDTTPTFDSIVPGSKFCGTEDDHYYPCGTILGDLSGLDADAEGQRIWNHEFGTRAVKSVLIGQAGGYYDSAPSPKSTTTLANLRGLPPADPSRGGSYTAAEIAHWAHRTDLNPAAGEQKLTTYAAALAPPLPEIKIQVGANTVSVVPFAKSVYGDWPKPMEILFPWLFKPDYIIHPEPGRYQPTDQIVDFYVASIKNTWTKKINGTLVNCQTASSAILAANRNDCNSGVNGGRPYYQFRINFEDVEQGADHDVDAISIYTVYLTQNNLVAVQVDSETGGGVIIQHMGYTITGAIETNASGTPIFGANNSIYLVVRDIDTSRDYSYFLDTPRGGLPLNSLRYFKVNTAADAATMLKDPLWFAAKYGGFTDSGILNGLPDSTPASGGKPYSSEWDADADGVPDNYFFVLNPLKLEQQLDKALESIQVTGGSSSAMTANSQTYKTGEMLYQAKYSSDGWGGELVAYSVEGNGSLTPTTWAAHQYVSSQQATSSRVILTYDKDRTSVDANGRPLRGIPFNWSNMTTSGTLQTALNMTAGGATDTLGAARVSYLRGEVVSGMRNRPVIPGTITPNLLGDIVNSGLQYVGAPASGHREDSYSAFVSSRQNRTAMVYVGANDGMLHGFDAKTSAERLAYIPYALYGGHRLSKLTAPDYGQTSNPHGYYVDGTPTIGDVCGGSCSTGADWKTILVGGLNRGGQGIYALDITDPAYFSDGNAANTVLWEFTDDMDNLPKTSPSPSPFGFTDDETTRYGLGYTYGQPSIVRICTQRDASSTTVPKFCPTANRKWVVVFGNGYNNAVAGNASTSGHAMLYVLDALTGKLLTKLSTKSGDTSSGGSNGLATVAPVDLDGDTVTDHVYAGDINGNMWKFDLSGARPPDWSVAYGTVASPAPLYNAKSATGTLQPITTPPEVALHPLGGTMVLFGTGKYLESVVDRASTSQQTFYGIWDNGNAVISSDRSNLQQQTIDTKQNATAIGIFNAGTNASVDWSSQAGWYIDLPEPRERVVYRPQLFGKMLYFPTLAPEPTECSFGGNSWDYFVNYLTGGAMEYSPFTGIGLLDIASGGTAVGVRRKSEVGMSPSGTLITKGNQGFLFKTGSKDATPEMIGLNFSKRLPRRVSWRELTAD